MTNDEAMYAWKAERIAAQPSIVTDSESWRRHPPGVPAATAILARAMPLESALALVSRIALLLALVAIALLAGRLAGPVAAGAAFCLLALDETVREWASHYLLDLPLVAVTCFAAWLWTFGGRARWGALALALLAPLVKTYGILLPLALVASAVHERLPRRWRLAAWAAAGAFVAVAFAVGAQGLIGREHYWLAPPADPLAATQQKLYHVAASFQWLARDARARTLLAILVAVAGFCAVFLRLRSAADRSLLVCLAAVPSVPLLATRIVEPRALLPVMAVIYVAIACSIGGAVSRLPSPRARRAASAILLVAGAGLLLHTERVRPKRETCRYAGQFELAGWLRAEVDPARDRVFAASSHQTRFYADLEFEKDGGPLYGENEWTGIPETEADFVAALAERPGQAHLALSADPDGRPEWLGLDGETARRLADLGFQARAVVRLPWDEACEPPTERAADEDAFWSQFGLERVAAGAAGKERLAGVVLTRDPDFAIGAK